MSQEPKSRSDLVALVGELHKDLLAQRNRVQSFADNDDPEWVGFDKGLRHALVRLEEICGLERVTT